MAFGQPVFGDSANGAEALVVNIVCLGALISSQLVHVPLSMTDACQLYQYD